MTDFLVSFGSKFTRVLTTTRSFGRVPLGRSRLAGDPRDAAAERREMWRATVADRRAYRKIHSTLAELTDDELRDLIVLLKSERDQELAEFATFVAERLIETR